MKATRFIIISSLLACIALYIVEQILVVDYITKTSVKLVLFFGIPIIYHYIFHNSKPLIGSKTNRLTSKKYFSGLLLGGISFLILLLTYYVMQNYLDTSLIVSELKQRGITPSVFIYIGLYITFGNSLLEEFFFRGFIFLNLFQQGRPRLAYLFSTSLFAIYHIGIFKTWFRPSLILLALLGLSLAGLIFNYVDTKSNNFVNSWLIHLSADAAIILIGCQMMRL